MWDQHTVYWITDELKNNVMHLSFTDSHEVYLYIMHRADATQAMIHKGDEDEDWVDRFNTANWAVSFSGLISVQFF